MKKQIATGLVGGVALTLVVGLLMANDSCSSQKPTPTHQASVGDAKPTEAVQESTIIVTELPQEELIANPSVEKRPSEHALNAFAGKDGTPYTQLNEETGKYEVERFIYVDAKDVKRLDPKWKGGDKRERFHSADITAACVVTGDECRYGVNDYAVTAVPVDGVHRAVKTGCVTAIVTGLNPPEDCPPVHGTCQWVSYGDCNLIAKGRELVAKGQLPATQVEDLQTSRLTCEDELRGAKAEIARLTDAKAK